MGFVLVLIENYVCKSVDSTDCPKCGEILEELEHVDQEAGNLDIIFVRIDDTKYAKKWGVTRIPALVYFRRKFPR